MASAFPYFISAVHEQAGRLRANWGWFLALGAALIIVGTLAIAYPVIASVATVEFFGYLLLIGSGVEIASMFWTPGWGGRFVHLLAGLLYFFVGVMIVEQPGLTMFVYTLLLAVFFVAGGLIRTVLALSHRFPGWGWSLVSGLVSLFLGILIWRQLPVSALWVIGTFVGIDLLFNGWSWVMLALGLRSLPVGSAARELPAPHAL